MSAVGVNNFNDNIEVVFHGYQSMLKPNKWWCLNCFERLYVKITEKNEYKYLSRNYLKLSQFTDAHHRSKSSYCTGCTEPLYDIATETCQHSSPTSNKWLQRFRINRHYGLRGGGTSQSIGQ